MKELVGWKENEKMLMGSHSDPETTFIVLKRK
jgi:hypothetical protein